MSEQMTVSRSLISGLSRISHGLFASVEAAVRTIDPIHPRDPGLRSLFGLGQPVLAGVNVDHETTMAIPAIFRGVNILSNGLARVPFYVFKTDDDGGKEYAKGHTSWRCVAVKPSPELKQEDFRRCMTAWAIRYGNAVSHIHRPNWPNGGPVKQTPLLPDRTRPVRITRQMIKRYDLAEHSEGQLYYETVIGGEPIAFAASECLHIRGLGPNPYWGYDIVDLLCQALGGAQARAEFGHRFYGQGANPAGFVEMPEGLEEEAEKRFVDSLKRGMEGIGKAHRVMVLEEGAKFKQWTVDPEKAQFLEGLEFDYRVLANIIGIKVHKLIDGANSSYNSLEMANAEHRDDDLLPWIIQWRGEYNDKMLTERQRNDMSHVIDVDDEYLDGWVPYIDRVNGAVLAKNNDLITRDQARRRLNWGPSRDRNGKRFTIPMNIEFTDDKISLAAAGVTGRQTPPPPKDDDADDPEPQQSSSSPLQQVEEAQSISGSPLPLVGEGLGVRAIEQAYRDFEVMRDAWLEKTAVKISKQARKLAAKSSPADLIQWVDSLSTEQAPAPIQEDVDGLYAQAKAALLAVIDRPPQAGEPIDLVAAVDAALTPVAETTTGTAASTED